MSHPYCTCRGSISASGSTFTQCALCKRGARMVTIEVDNESWPRVQAALQKVTVESNLEPGCNDRSK